MKRKIALEEHIESPDFPATGTHNFTDPTYFGDVENRLQEYKLRLEDMDATGIETTILSLTQPGVEGINEAKCAIDTAKKIKRPHGELLCEKQSRPLPWFRDCSPAGSSRRGQGTRVRREGTWIRRRQHQWLYQYRRRERGSLSR
jgi:hypothetical protein